MSLKTFCNLLSRRPLALDAMLLFVSPSSLLLPLCRLIDNWKYEDDHGMLTYVSRGGEDLIADPLQESINRYTMNSVRASY